MLLENLAFTEMTESSAAALKTRKPILTELSETITSLAEGRLVPSSGRAEAKVQSSSAVIPLLACCNEIGFSDCVMGGFREATSKSDGEGEGAES